MRPGAAPISEQIMFDLIIPPVGAALWWMMSRGWARSVQQGEISKQTKRRQKRESGWFCAWRTSLCWASPCMEF